MTGDELRDFTTQLLSGTELEDTFFFQSVNMQKGLIENGRDWVVLRNLDTSKAFTSADDYEDTKALPERFLRTYTPTDPNTRQNAAVSIVDSAGNKHALRPIPFASRYEYKDTDGYFYIDHANSAIGRTGTLAGTLHLFYLKDSPDIEEEVEWLFPEWAHPLLAYKVAITHKGGIDYDTINASQVPFNREDARALESRLASWDAQLQLQELGL